MKEYSAQYYYKNGKMPPNYQKYIDILEKIHSESFRKYLKQYLLFQTATSMEQKYAAFDGAILAIESKLEDIDFHLELIHQIPIDQYKNIEQVLSQNILEDNIIETEDRVFIPITAA